MHENREISGASRSETDRDRLAKAESHNAGAHAPEKSDRAVVPMNQPNKGDVILAEVGEERAWAKENIVPSYTSPTQSGRTRSQGLSDVRQAGTSLRRYYPRQEPYALTRSYGSVRGAISDGRPYRDSDRISAKTT